MSAAQVRKTLRKPSRLIFIPYFLIRSYFFRLVVSLGGARLNARKRLAKTLPRSVAAMAARIEERLFRRMDEEYYFRRGVELFEDNRPGEAWRLFSEGLKTTSNYLLFRTASVCLYLGLGRMREAIPVQRRADEVRLAMGAARGVTNSRYLVLDRLWIEHIGHAAQVDYIIKWAIMEGRDLQDIILFFPPELKVANRFVVNQWAPHLRIVTSAEELPFPESFQEFLALNFFVPNVTADARLFLWELAAQTYRRWHKRGGKPLLSLPDDVIDRGCAALASVGIATGAWFVCLHIREPGYKTHHRDLHDVLNASIGDYLPAIEEITRRGGWVIRMGDPSMTRLPPMRNVLDYCHSVVRSEWMDVFLAARCRFFIGTSSGVCYVAQNYGVPCVLTNWWPPAQRPWQPGDIFIPKLQRRLRTGEFLTLEQSLQEPFGYCHSLDYLKDAHDVVVEDNDPEDIRDAVVEAFERIGDVARYDEMDVAMGERAERIYASVAMELYGSSGAFGAAAMARGFLRRHPALLKT